MTQQGRWRRRLGVVSLAALSLLGGQGCLSFVHSLPLPPKEQIVQSEGIPAPARHHVHIFLIHGLDPLDLANLGGLTEYINQLGYFKTHYGQLYHLWEFKKEVARIHKQDPQARFVVMGFSFGANVARALVNAVKEEGVFIDLLIYMGGNTLDNTPRTQPEHVVHIVNILALGCIWNGAEMDRADNIHYNDVCHFGSPTHPKTRELLARELAAVAARVPYVEKVPPLSPEIEQEIPLPRRLGRNRLPQETPPLPAEWNFLSARTASQEPRPPQLALPTNNTRRIPFAVVP